MGIKGAYSKSTLISLGTLSAQVGFGLFTIVLLAKYLPKAEFGYLILSLTAVQLAASVLSTSIEKTTLFVVSRQGEGGRPQEKSTFIIIAALVGGAGTLVCLLIAVFLKRSGMTPTAEWIAWLSPLVFATCLRSTINACLRAAQRASAFALLEYGLPSTIRFVGIVILILLSHISTVPPIAMAFVIGALLPALIGLILLMPGLGFPKSIRQTGVIRYGLTVMLTKLTSEPNKSLDVVLVGAMTSPLTSADYGLASRLANALSLVKQAIDTLLVPRIGHLHATGNSLQLRKEYALARDAGLSALLLAGACFCLIGEPVLQYLGNYEQAYQVILILLAAAIIRVGVGSTGNYLNMIGKPGMNLIATGTGVGVLLASSLFLIPVFGAKGGAVAVILSQVFMNGCALAVIYRINNILLINPTIVMVLLMSTLSLISLGVGWSPVWLPVAVLISLALIILIRNFGPKPKLDGVNT